MRPGRYGPRAAILLPFALAAALPLLLSTYWLFLATSAVIAAIVAQSVGVVTGRAGMISLAPLSFAGIGGYMVSWFTASELGAPLVVQLLAAALVAAAIGALVGLPALRLRGINLAIVTLGVASTVSTLLALRDFPGAATFTTVGRPKGFESDGMFYLFCLGCFALIAVLLAWTDRSRLGASWTAVRHSERAAAAAGLSVPSTKLSAFAVSAAVAGLGGGLLAAQNGLLTVDYFLPLSSLVVFATAVLAGAHRTEGAALAGALVIFTPEVLRRLQLPQDLGNAIFAVGTIAVLATGASVADRLHRLTTRRSLQRPPAPAGAEQPPLPIQAPRAGSSAPDRLLLELARVTVRYGKVVALDDVRLEIQDGTVTGLIGPNGAGKSTLIDVISGFVASERGEVAFAGRPIHDLPPHRRARAGIRRTFQLDRTILSLTVERYVRLAARRRLDEHELRALLSFFGCSEPQLPLAVADVRTRRLAEIAGALASRPRLLLLDEPAAGLPPVQSLELAERIAATPERFGCAVLLVEHDMELVRKACSDLTVLDFGRLVAHGPVDDVLAREEVVAAYLGAEIPS